MMMSSNLAIWNKVDGVVQRSETQFHLMYGGASDRSTNWEFLLTP